tara:strand:+ start:42466 stop:43824 length:1359 start_codon:yes stop_codon:yes gene_type:complete
MQVGHFPASAASSLIEGYCDDFITLASIFAQTLEQVSMRSIDISRSHDHLTRIEGGMRDLSAAIRDLIDRDQVAPVKGDKTTTGNDRNTQSLPNSLPNTAPGRADCSESPSTPAPRTEQGPSDSPSEPQPAKPASPSQLDASGFSAYLSDDESADLVTDAPITKSRSLNIPNVKAPIADSPIVKAPLGKAALAQSPIANATAAKAPIAKAPIANAPGANAPIPNAPAAKAPVAKAPAAKAPAAKAPVAKAPAANAPVAKVPTAAAPITRPRQDAPTAVPTNAIGASSPQDAKSAVALNSTSASMPILTVFQFIERMRKSGVMTVVVADETMTFEFDYGCVQACSTNSTNKADRLGHILQEDGTCDADALRDILSQADGKSSLQIGELIVRANLATNNQVMDALETQARRRFQRACDAEDAAYTFVEGGPSRTDGRIRIAPKELGHESSWQPF